MSLITLSHRGGQQLRVETRQIESIEADPDVRVLLVTGQTAVVREPVDAVIDAIVEARRRRFLGLPINKGRTGLS